MIRYAILIALCFLSSSCCHLVTDDRDDGIGVDQLKNAKFVAVSEISYSFLEHWYMIAEDKQPVLMEDLLGNYSLVQQEADKSDSNAYVNPVQMKYQWISVYRDNRAQAYRSVIWISDSEGSIFSAPNLKEGKFFISSEQGSLSTELREYRLWLKERVEEKRSGTVEAN